MKLSLHKNRVFPVAILIAASVAYLSISQQAEAAVIWLASDDGTDLTLTTNGGSLTYRYAVNLQLTNSLATGVYTSDSNSIIGGAAGPGGINPTVGLVTLGGQHILTDPWIIATNGSGVGTGSAFGYVGTDLIVPHSTFPTGTVTITPSSTIVFSGLTVDMAFGTNLDAGPVLLWRALTGDPDAIISIGRAPAPVPEPTSSVLLALGGLGLLLRRRK